MLRLALRVWEAVQAGHELILMCENDLGCQQVRCITPPGFIAHVRYPVWEFVSVPSNKRPQAKFAPLPQNALTSRGGLCTAVQVLKLRFPGVPLAPDITSLLHLPPGTQIVTAGFPCIDLSRAGLRMRVHLGQVCPTPSALK